MIDVIYADVIECAGTSNYMCILLAVQHKHAGIFLEHERSA